jgi:hypothetical protein
MSAGAESWTLRWVYAGGLIRILTTALTALL